MSFDTRRTGRGNRTFPNNFRGRGNRALPITSPRYPASRQSTKNDSLPPDRDISEGLQSKAIQSVTRPPTTHGAGTVEARDVKPIGSYNWVDAAKPTMIVPGSPRKWRNRAPPFQVQPDSGIVFCDQNGYRMPKYVLLPLIRAVEHTEVDFDWSSVDFVTDRNALRKILRWLGSTKNSECKDFRIDTQLAGNGTVLFNRWDKRYRESFGGAGYSTYGFNFEKATTTESSDCQDSTGHHRIVTYNLNGLKLVVRFEVDACLPPSVAKPKGASASDIDALADALSNTSLASTPKEMPSATEDKYGLRVLRGGNLVDQDNVAELTTISARRRGLFNWAETYPQLFLSQTPHHLLGVHDRGRFESIEQRKLGSADLRSIEESLQGILWQLRLVLDVIKALVVKHGSSGRLSLVCQGGELKVYKRSSEDSCLPEDILSRFDI